MQACGQHLFKVCPHPLPHEANGLLMMGSLLVEAQQLAADAAGLAHCWPTVAADGQLGCLMGRQGSLHWGQEATATFCT